MKIKKEIRFISYKDDDDKVKEKYAFIVEDGFWIHIQFVDIKTKQEYGKPFKIPRNRVLKIKETGIFIKEVENEVP